MIVVLCRRGRTGLSTDDISHPTCGKAEVRRSAEQDALTCFMQTIGRSRPLIHLNDPESAGTTRRVSQKCFHAFRGLTMPGMQNFILGYDWELFCPRAWDRSRWG